MKIEIMKARIDAEILELFKLALTHTNNNKKPRYSLKIIGHVNWIELQHEGCSCEYYDLYPYDFWLCSDEEIKKWYNETRNGLKSIKRYMKAHH